LLKKSIVLVCIVLAVLILRPGTQSTIMSYYHSTLDESSLKGSSFRWRFSVWNMAVNRIKKSNILHMLFGYGSGSHIFMDFGLVALSTGHYAEMQSWDCEYAVILFEKGIIGFSLQAIFYILLLFKAIEYCYKHKEENKQMLLTLSCLSIFIFMKTNVMVYAPQLIYLEFINISILSKLIEIEKSIAPEKQLTESDKENEA